eukprot:1444212-Amphidinium_carterae.4
MTPFSLHFRQARARKETASAGQLQQWDQMKTDDCTSCPQTQDDDCTVAKQDDDCIHSSVLQSSQAATSLRCSSA